MKTLPNLLSLLVLCAGSAEANAESAWRLGLALGAGERTNPLIESKRLPIAVDVDVAWFGERFFFDNGDLGFTVLDRPSGTLNLVARVNSDRVFFGRTNTKFVNVSVTGASLPAPVELRVPERSWAIEVGAEWLADGDWGALALAAHRDASGTHGGHSADAEYSYTFRGRRWSLEPGISAHYKSAALGDYYWGVRPGEASTALPPYTAGAGVNWEASLRASWYLSRHWRLAASAHYERLNAAVADSPLTKDRAVKSWFAGIAWRY
ncbi:MAG: MipA/OmpV family protein [Steroidobacteraceae bacterium]|jgi:outer membrane protein|nr:MipA/OmpV family protein [Steroidobacteraceae bacterium]